MNNYSPAYSSKSSARETNTGSILISFSTKYIRRAVSCLFYWLSNLLHKAEGLLYTAWSPPPVGGS